MSFLQSMNISGSGLTAQKLRMDIIAENIANMDATRTAEGGPYRRKLAVFQSMNTSDSGAFNKMLFENIKDLSNTDRIRGVEVTEIVEDPEPFKMVYDPTHPDADENGYVAMPNVNSLKETSDMMEALRAYDANITAFNAIKKMASNALELGK